MRKLPLLVLLCAAVALGAPAAGLARSTGTCTPTTLAATAVTASSATLNGTVASNGNRYFQWGTTIAYGNTTPTSLGTGAFSYALTGLAAGTTYHFAAACLGVGTASDLTFTTSPGAASGSESADLGVTLTVSPATVTAGGQVTFTAVATNVAGAEALESAVIDNLPPGFALVSAAVTRGTCSGTSRVACTIGSLVRGQSETVTIVATANVAGTLSNTVEVGARNPDPNVVQNNRATATVQVTAPAATTTSAGATTPGTAARPAPPVVARTITATVQGSTITGRLEASAGECVSTLYVRLHGPTPSSTSLTTIRTAADGSFRFTRPRPAGTYVVIVNPQLAGGKSCAAARSGDLKLSAR